MVFDAHIVLCLFLTIYITTPLLVVTVFCHYQLCVSFNSFLCAKCLQSCENMKVHSEAYTQIHTLYVVAFERLTGE